MRNCSYCKVIVKISQAKRGSEDDPKHKLTLSPSSFFTLEAPVPIFTSAPGWIYNLGRRNKYGFKRLR
ncbi:hypothetical protein ES703_01730 [subsurface metagenome]